MAQRLRDGACPKLEQLWFSLSYIGDVGVVELARALDGGAPCSSILLRLKLNSCEISAEGMTELAHALAHTACPNLEYLDLSDNNLEDDGVVALAESIGEGALEKVKEINLTFTNVGDLGVSALFQVR